MATKGNQKKLDQLGMDAGTASHQLKQMIMLSLIQELQRDSCFRCGEKIAKVSELSIDHKEPWLDNDPSLFWDVAGNIAFSHKRCNGLAARRPHKIVDPEGQGWCNRCKQFLDLSSFPPSYTEWYEKRGSRRPCTECYSKLRQAYRVRTGKR